MVESDISKLIGYLSKIVHFTYFDHVEQTDNVCLQVVFQNTSSCYVFKRGNITIQTSNSAADRVAVKIPNAPTTCFSDHYSYFNQSFTETLNGKQIIRSQFSYSSGQYRVVYTVSICPNTTDLYTRKVGTKTYQVCVGFRMFPGGSGSFYDAQNLCKTNGGYGLTGPLNAPEYDILKIDRFSISLLGTVLVSDKGIAFRQQNGQSANALIWIDGISYTNDNNIYNFVFEDESHNGLTGYPMHSGDPNDNPPSALYWYGAIGDYFIADYA
ncbi:hypothetical protein B9Z55_004236 [Caenorhabditis nigoni]|nr:hypothetical protein B9Z55_004236 [Caenorhabditis nigoni]